MPGWVVSTAFAESAAVCGDGVRVAEIGMNFNYWDLGQQPSGAIVQVTLRGNAANVRLFDSSNYNAFKAGRRATSYGGYVTRSPVRLQIPNSGHWYIVIDYGGLTGRGRAGVQVLQLTGP
jgi:Domain of unknown function (DUF1883)